MRTLVVFSVFIALLAAASGAQAEDKALGQKHFKAGVSLLKAEEYEAAVLSFEASLKAFPTKYALFNLANCHKALKNYDEALAALFRLRRDFAGQLDAELAREVASLEQEIRNLVGTLVVEVDRPGATVLVNGREMGRSPLAKPLLLVPGDHVVTARLDGVVFGIEKVRLLSGDERRVSLTGTEKATADQPGPVASTAPSTSAVEPDPQPAIDEAPSGNRPSALFWGVAGGAVVTGVLSGVFFSLRGKAEGAFDDALEDWDALSSAEQASVAGDGPLGDMKSAGEDYDKWNGAGIGMAVTAGALTAAAVVILIVDMNSGEEKPAEDKARVAIHPALGGMHIDF